MSWSSVALAALSGAITTGYGVGDDWGLGLFAGGFALGAATVSAAFLAGKRERATRLKGEA